MRNNHPTHKPKSPKSKFKKSNKNSIKDENIILLFYIIKKSKIYKHNKSKNSYNFVKLGINL